MNFPWKKKQDPPQDDFSEEGLMRDSIPVEYTYFFGNHMFESGNRRSRFLDIYYNIRWFVVHTLNPRSIYREVKWFLQRGRRGWADCDTWSLDDYVSRWMPDALVYLREHKHGVPNSCFGPEDTHGLYGGPSADEMARAEARWNSILSKIIEGFKAHHRIADGIYESQLGPYSFERPIGLSSDAWEAIKDKRRLDSKVLEEKDEALFQEGMKLFQTHYRDLWD